MTLYFLRVSVQACSPVHYKRAVEQLILTYRSHGLFILSDPNCDFDSYFMKATMDVNGMGPRSVMKSTEPIISIKTKPIYIHCNLLGSRIRNRAV